MAAQTTIAGLIIMVSYPLGNSGLPYLEEDDH